MLGVEMFDEIRVMSDEKFAEAQASMDAGYYQAAYERCDDLKKFIERKQSDASHKMAGVTTTIGVVAGFVAPGIGNIVGGILGAAAGNYLGRYFGNIAFKSGGTIQEVLELAIAGKVEAKSAQTRKHLGEPVLQNDSIYKRWLRIRREVLGV